MGRRVRQSQTGLRRATLCGFQATAKGLGLHGVRECAPAVDLDDREPLAVQSLELRDARDVHFFELELELAPQLRDGGSRALAEVTIGRVEDDDAGYG